MMVEWREEASPGVFAGTPVVVTGASGFIGGRLVERLGELGAKVTCLVRGSNSTTRMHRAGARIVRLDLADAGAVADALRRTKIVVHLAYDWADSAWNGRALAALIDGCLATGARLVHVSSFVVYDVPACGDVSEDNPPTPAGDGYPRVKLELEAEVLRAVRERRLAATIIQPTIVYGPFCGPWTDTPAQQLRFGTVVLPDRGEGLCNAVYVDDVVQAMLLAAVRPAAIGQRYLISGAVPISWGEFYEGMARAIGAGGPQYWPSEKIERAGVRTSRLRTAMGNPEELLRRLLKTGPGRTLVEAGLRFAPASLRRDVHVRFYGPDARRPGFVHVPSAAHLRFVQGRSVVRIDKVRRELGYAPDFDFTAGMVPTARYLETLGAR